jgi:hypothetical protein
VPNLGDAPLSACAGCRSGVGARLIVVAVALGGAATAATASGAAQKEPVYTRAATQSCLTRLPNTIAGLPPARPPAPPALFVYAPAHDVISTGGVGPRPRAHKQLGAWYGEETYEGIILSFFKSVHDARASLKTLAWLYGGKLIRNVVVTWDQKSVPSGSMRKTVLGCLHSQLVGRPAAERPPPATLATFAGRWGGHTRGLSITSTGRGQESADSGCCKRVYQLTFQILSVKGTLTRATAVYRVASFRRYEGGVRRLHQGDLGKLVMKDGIVTNTLTEDFFCSDPAWGATGACGA